VALYESTPPVLLTKSLLQGQTVSRQCRKTEFTQELHQRSRRALSLHLNTRQKVLLSDMVKKERMDCIENSYVASPPRVNPVDGHFDDPHVNVISSGVRNYNSCRVD
jgi:hypothetical protein